MVTGCQGRVRVSQVVRVVAGGWKAASPEGTGAAGRESPEGQKALPRTGT